MVPPASTTPMHTRTPSNSSVLAPGLPQDPIKGVIMLGGPATDSWFRPLSLVQPKPLFPVAGHPMIYHHVKSLARFESLAEILLIGFYEGALFEPFVKSIREEFDIEIRYLQEPKSLGTGGGLIHFRDQILANSPRYIFVLYADICCSFPLGRMLLAQHRATGTLATILATHVTREESLNYGCLVKEEESDSQYVRHYVEKPETFVSTLVSCGVYLLDSKIFEEIPSLPRRIDDGLQVSPLLSANGNGRPKIVRLEQDILVPMAAERKVSFYETQDFWCQVKTPNSAITANRLLLDDSLFRDPGQFEGNKEEFEVVGAVHVDKNTKISPDARLGPNVSIGPNCTIAPGVRIRDSIILPGCTIGTNTLVSNSIIGHDSSVGAWCRIEGAPDGATTDAITVNGIKMPSITVLGGTVNVSDETVIRNCIVLPHKDLCKSYQNEILL